MCFKIICKRKINKINNYLMKNGLIKYNNVLHIKLYFSKKNYYSDIQMSCSTILNRENSKEKNENYLYKISG